MVVRIAPAVPPPQRRAADHPFYVRAFRWTLAPLTDSWRGLSLTRLLALLIVLLVAYIAIVTRNITWVMFAMTTAALSAAFGKGVFGGEFLSRVSFGTPVNEVRDHTETTTTHTETPASEETPTIPPKEVG